MSDGEAANARHALARLIAGEGLAMAAQPIVDLRRRLDPRLRGAGALRAPALGQQPPALVRARRGAGRTGGAGTGLPASGPGAVRAATRGHAALAQPLCSSPARPTDPRPARPGRGRPGARLEGLIVEITEETLVSNDADVGEAIEALRERGAGLAVDDIGAGYSGLRQITTVLPDYLKLDRSLICGIDGDPDRAALVSALAGYASQVGSLLVAEGIEHLAELRCLQELGVPLVQGFYLAYPGKPWPQLSHEAALALAEPASATVRKRRRAALQPA